MDTYSVCNRDATGRIYDSILCLYVNKLYHKMHQP